MIWSKGCRSCGRDSREFWVFSGGTRLGLFRSGQRGVSALAGSVKRVRTMVDTGAFLLTEF